MGEECSSGDPDPEVRGGGLQERVRRLEKTSKAKSATCETKKRVEVVEDFQTPNKTATASRATNQDSGTQTPGGGSRRWRR